MEERGCRVMYIDYCFPGLRGTYVALLGDYWILDGDALGIANATADLIREMKPSKVVVDTSGVGASVADRLVDMFGKDMIVKQLKRYKGISDWKNVAG